ncbi:hypothetical protein RJT34_23950 [Clitoria ternatea]|uniref:Uncharacterized protein n=1 Tax=Clitoria ternatea TaxID=43366 RepID=A0AAN9FPX5_CLITE
MMIGWKIEMQQKWIGINFYGYFYCHFVERETTLIGEKDKGGLRKETIINLPPPPSSFFPNHPPHSSHSQSQSIITKRLLIL